MSALHFFVATWFSGFGAGQSQDIMLDTHGSRFLAVLTEPPQASYTTLNRQLFALLDPLYLNIQLSAYLLG
jgi:hypothetical protein